MNILIEIIGWVGAIEVLAAYFLISYNKVSNKSALYQFLNLTGAIFLIINTIYLKAYPSAFVNVIWMFIAGVALWKIRK
jgi:hypothetical protein